eukprot:4177021-Lingulodinium_polyedra.AAC.1
MAKRAVTAPGHEQAASPAPGDPASAQAAAELQELRRQQADIQRWMDALRQNAADVPAAADARDGAGEGASMWQ